MIEATQFNHVTETLCFGYSRMEVAARQFAFVASPEKALLDLVYLTPGADSEKYLHELRLQNAETMDVSTLDEFARRSGKAKLRRAARLVRCLIEAEGGESL